jgi:hypothetical protein
VEVGEDKGITVLAVAGAIGLLCGGDGGGGG